MTSKDNVIGNDIKEFSQNFKKNLLDAWTWIIIIPIVVLLFVTRKLWLGIIKNFLIKVVPAVFAGLISDPQQLVMTSFILVILLLVILKTYYFSTGKGLNYLFYKLNLL